MLSGVGGVELAQGYWGMELASHSFLWLAYFLAPHLVDGGSPQRFGDELNHHVVEKLRCTETKWLIQMWGQHGRKWEKNPQASGCQASALSPSFSNLCLVNSYFISWGSYTRVHRYACGFGGSLLSWRRPHFGVMHQRGKSFSECLRGAWWMQPGTKQTRALPSWKASSGRTPMGRRQLNKPEEGWVLPRVTYGRLSHSGHHLHVTLGELPNLYKPQCPHQ